MPETELRPFQRRFVSAVERIGSGKVALSPNRKRRPVRRSPPQPDQGCRLRRLSPLAPPSGGARIFDGPRCARIAFTTHSQPRPSTRSAGPTLRYGPLGVTVREALTGHPGGWPSLYWNEVTVAARSVVAEHRQKRPESCATPAP